MSVVYRLTQDNRKQSKTKGKWYARSLHTGVIDIDGLANIMQANCTLKKSDILAVIAELVDVMRAQLQNSQKVILGGLGSFKVGLKTKPADTSLDFNPQKNIVGARVLFHPTTYTTANRKRTSFLLQGMTVKEATKYDVKKPKKTRKAASGDTSHVQ